MEKVIAALQESWEDDRTQFSHNLKTVYDVGALDLVSPLSNKF